MASIRACGWTLNLVRRAIAILGMVSGRALLLVVGLICSEVLLRYAFNRPILGSVEITEYMLVFIVFFGMAYTQSVAGHIKIEVIPDHLSPKLQHILRIVSLIVALGIFAIITWKTAQGFWESWQVKEVRWGAVPLPIWPVKFVVPAGTLMLCVQFIINLVDEALQWHPEHGPGEVP